MQLTIAQFLVAWALAGAASVAVFLHANRKGVQHATAWGAGVFLALAFALPLYVISYLRRKRSGR